ncbi:MAG: type II toxin-antitoxin system RelE/ParE family toxin [Bdellovibrio sp.]|nr:type II toxin-antitoxin system RelE/ParE family toxin [Bdellovibrio sp.]
MATYSIQIKKSAQKEIKSLPSSDKQRIIAKIYTLAKNPRGPDSKKLSGQEKYRVRVGMYRILYEIHDIILVIIIVRVAHRQVMKTI